MMVVAGPRERKLSGFFFFLGEWLVPDQLGAQIFSLMKSL